MSNAPLAISYADLSGIARALDRLSSTTDALTDQITDVQSSQVVLLSKIENLASAFLQFYEEDKKAKQLALAETRLVGIRQEVETKFGYFAEVRRMATGILQALDAGLVSPGMLSSATDEMMLKAPGYWLAPALVALSSWIRNDRALADRAVTEALRRDDFKTSLFFGIVCKRMHRLPAAAQWLERYLRHLDAHALDREFVVLLDAIATGMFGAEGHGRALPVIKAWLQSEASADFAQEQERRWTTALTTFRPITAGPQYKVLRQYSPTHDLLEAAMRSARMHGVMHQHFARLFGSELVPPASLNAQVDSILDKLVTHFDDAELVLRKQERRNILIIEADGAVDLAEAKLKAEESAFEEKVNFAQMMTNAALLGDASHASPATQRLAIALSVDWIVAAHDAWTARARAEVPRDVVLRIDDWSATTQDGSDESSLLEKQRQEYEARRDQRLKTVKPTVWVYVLPVVAVVTAYVHLVFGAVAALIALVYGFLQFSKLKTERKAIEGEVAARHANAAAILRAAIAELVDHRREFSVADADAEKVRQFILDLRPDQHVRSRPVGAPSTSERG